MLGKLAARPALLERYQANIRKLKLRSGAPEICAFLYGLVKKPKKPKKQTMGEALRRFRDAVVAEGEAFSRRIEKSGSVRRLKRAAAARRGGTSTGSSGRTSTRSGGAKRHATLTKRAR